MRARRPRLARLERHRRERRRLLEFDHKLVDRQVRTAEVAEVPLDAFTGADVELPRVVKLAVREMPGSGTPAQMLSKAGIDAEHITRAVKALVEARIDS